MVARESKRAKRNLVHASAILIKLSASVRTAAARTTSGSATARSATRIAGRSAGSGGRPGVIVGSRRSGVIVRCRRAIIGRSRLGSIIGRRSSRGSAVRRRSMMMIRGCRLVRDAVGVKTSTLEAVATHIGPIYLRMGKIEKISRSDCTRGIPKHPPPISRDDRNIRWPDTSHTASRSAQLAEMVMTIITARMINCLIFISLISKFISGTKIQKLSLKFSQALSV